MANASGESSGYYEQKQDVSESYYGADGPQLVPGSRCNDSLFQRSGHVEDDDDDVYRSISGVSMRGDEDSTSAFVQGDCPYGGSMNFGLPQQASAGAYQVHGDTPMFSDSKLGSSAQSQYQYGESYGDGIVRSLDFGMPQQHQPLRDSPLEMFPEQSRMVHDQKFPIQMAQAPNLTMKTLGIQVSGQEAQFRKRAGNNMFWNDEQDDESSSPDYGHQSMDMADMADDGWGKEASQWSFFPLPECYRKDSTYQSIVSGCETVDAVERALMVLGKGNNSVNFSRGNCSQFSGHFFERAKCCEFVVNTYKGVQDTREQIWVECRNLDSSLSSKQAFAVFIKEMVATLTQWGIIKGLVHREFVAYTALQDESGAQDNSSPTDDEEVRGVIQERVRGLKQAVFLGEQREFSEEILFLAEQHPRLVAENPELAPVLTDLLGNHAKTDVYMSRTILRVMRALMAYNRFEEGLKKANSDPIKMLLQISKKTENLAWQGELFNTVLELQKIGFTCNGKRANAEYRRIEARVGGPSLQ